MDGDNKKPNHGGELQPYIPKGNGERSGEYTLNMTYSYFCIREKCTKKDLGKLLSEDEYLAVTKYSDFEFGRSLNKRLRDGMVSKKDEKIKELIESAIKKHRILNRITVYRGISVSKEIYNNKFYSNYKRGNIINGSIICSTSRSKARAIAGAYPKENNFIEIIFKIELKVGTKALPIKDISFNPDEKEVILFNPQYTIKKIDDVHMGDKLYKHIEIELER